MKSVTIARNPVYRHLWTDRSRFNVVYGGAGSGKSYAVAQRLVHRFASEPGRNILVIRKVGRTNRLSTFALIKHVLSRFGILDAVTVRESDMTITEPTGNMIVFEGLDDIEKIKSITFPSGPLTDIWVEEASEISQEDLRQLNLRLRGRAPHPFQITLTFNPISVDHWLKAEFFDNPKPNALTMRTTYLDNRFIDDDYRGELEALRVSDPTMYQVYALGEWGQLGDAAFPLAVFEPCRYKPGDFDRVVYGMDFGFQHYHAIEAIGIKDGELYSFREMYCRQQTNPEIIAQAEQVLSKAQRVVADSAEPKSIAEWRAAGYRVEAAKKGPDSVEAQFGYLRARKWHIDPVACPGLAAEVRGAVYKKDKSGRVTEEIVSFHDDALAACRYGVEELVAPRIARPVRIQGV